MKTSTRATPFRAHLDGRPEVGQREGWTPREWRRAPKCLVRVTDLVATNHDHFLDERRVARYVRRAPRDLPWVMRVGDCLYVVDGHHRVAAAFRRGEEHILAHVMTVRPGRATRSG